MTHEDEPLGWVPVEGRGSLPFALVHGESLVAAASWAVGEAGIVLFDASVTFDQVRRSGRALLLHDPLCPLTPVDFLAEAAATCEETGAVVVGFRPVTDTVKRSSKDSLGETVDRSGLRAITSPVVVPPAVLAGLERLDTSDFPALVADLATRAEVVWLEAPPLSRRVRDEHDLADLEALSRAEGASAT
ncbi:2-C-methyl-D-erythritol 4-phosphate cytidylyltransferase [Nocardioides pocheonensis]|uniref:2-C-methyl-D-erythritol 4-phosphate cytidylyltransferase n=1 Tax=Nocardioides pocheonensis TaxID=661485 RepID=UPI001FED239E|nr:2-C-methyl-D-erythritol 4-phosphate cytidylyltransferase [Nocardioides pocheonensis]